MGKGYPPEGSTEVQRSKSVRHSMLSLSPFRPMKVEAERARMLQICLETRLATRLIKRGAHGPIPVVSRGLDDDRNVVLQDVSLLRQFVCRVVNSFQIVGAALVPFS